MVSRHRVLAIGAAVGLALSVLVLGAESNAPSGGAASYTYKYDSVNRLSLPELLAKYRDKDWEIKGIFPNEKGHLGTYRVGDLIGGGNIQFSIGPVGLDGVGYYVQEKPFSRGQPVIPVLCLMDNGRVVERLPFDKGYC